MPDNLCTQADKCSSALSPSASELPSLMIYVHIFVVVKLCLTLLGTQGLQPTRLLYPWDLYIYIYLHLYIHIFRTSLVAQTVKRLFTMQETWVRSLSREDPLEKEMATHSSILAWKIPWTEELGGLQSTGLKESDTTEQLHLWGLTWASWLSQW